MTNEAADILRKAKELIETKGWTQKVMARNAKGSPIDPRDAAARSFCLEGALVAAGASYPHPSFTLLSQALGGNVLLYKWNDKRGRSKKEAAECLDHAIALAEAGKS